MNHIGFQNIATKGCSQCSDQSNTTDSHWRPPIALKHCIEIHFKKATQSSTSQQMAKQPQRPDSCHAYDVKSAEIYWHTRIEVNYFCEPDNQITSLILLSHTIAHQNSDRVGQRDLLRYITSWCSSSHELMDHVLAWIYTRNSVILQVRVTFQGHSLIKVYRWVFILREITHENQELYTPHSPSSSSSPSHT